MLLWYVLYVHSKFTQERHLFLGGFLGNSFAIRMPVINCGKRRQLWRFICSLCIFCCPILESSIWLYNFLFLLVNLGLKLALALLYWHIWDFKWGSGLWFIMTFKQLHPFMNKCYIEKGTHILERAMEELKCLALWERISETNHVEKLFFLMCKCEDIIVMLTPKFSIKGRHIIYFRTSQSKKYM